MRNKRVLELAVNVNNLMEERFGNNFSENNSGSSERGFWSTIAQYPDNCNNYNYISLSQNVNSDKITISIDGFDANKNDSLCLDLWFDLKTGKLNYSREGYFLKDKCNIDRMYNCFQELINNI